MTTPQYELAVDKGDWAEYEIKVAKWPFNFIFNEIEYKRMVMEEGDRLRFVIVDTDVKSVIMKGEHVLDVEIAVFDVYLNGELVARNEKGDDRYFNAFWPTNENFYRTIEEKTNELFTEEEMVLSVEFGLDKIIIRSESKMLDRKAETIIDRFFGILLEIKVIVAGEEMFHAVLVNASKPAGYVLSIILITAVIIVMAAFVITIYTQKRRTKILTAK